MASNNLFTEQQSNYHKIDQIFNKYQTEPLDKINIYAVLSFVSKTPKQTSSRQYCSSFSIVDDSCSYEQKIKCNLFSSIDETNLCSVCEVGDIIRIHRIKIQTFERQPQGVGTSFCSWIRFKRDDESFEYVGNKNTSIDDYDRFAVKHLRDWLKTNPSLSALNGTLIPKPNETLILENAALLMNTHQSVPIQIDSNFVHAKLKSARPISLSNITPDNYFDIICQICALCEHNGIKFIIVWDATKSKLAVQQENEFLIEKTLSTATDLEAKVFYSKQTIEYMFQVYIFDEFVMQLETLEPGDFVILKNARSNKIPSQTADMAIKMPGLHQNINRYGRVIGKIAPPFADIDSLNLPKPSADIIKFIQQKGRELGADFKSAQEFKSDYCRMHALDDDTMDELVMRKNNLLSNQPCETINNRQQELAKTDEQMLQINKKTTIDKLLEDEENMYMTAEDEDSDGTTNREKETFMVSNKENATPTKHVQSTLSRINLSPINNANTTNRNVTVSNLTLAHLSPSPVKRIKKHDLNEISNDIMKLKRLVNMTYIVPYFNINSIFDNEESKLPYFNSLKHLEEEALRVNHLRCKVSAKLFNYSISSGSQLTDVYVLCRKCNYINFAPFHLAHISHGSIIPKMFGEQDSSETKKQAMSSTSLFDSSTQKDSLKTSELDQVDKKDDDQAIRISRNFSLEWLNSAMPIEVEMQASQESVQYTQTNINNNNNNCSNDEQSETPMMFYECPRCSFLNDSQQSNECVKLDYIFRFWFILRDANSKLSNCLLEADLAKRFLDSICPFKFYNNKKYSNKVFELIHRKFDKKFLFTIESFKLNNSKFASIECKNKNLNILYKIVDMEGLVPI